MEKSKVAGVMKCRISLVVAVILLYCACSHAPVARAQDQTGFLNIDCGSNRSYGDPVTGLNWVPDAMYITTGKSYTNLTIARSILPRFAEFASLRYFDDIRSKKYCYSLPVTQNTTYLLRVSFLYGNYDNVEKPPSFQVAIDATVVTHVTTSSDKEYFWEYTYLSQGNVTFLCLIRTSPDSNPLISAISLKPSRTYPGMTNILLGDRRYLVTRTRTNFGGTGLIRYPTDPYDRYWFPEGEDSNYLKRTTSPLQVLKTNHSIDTEYGFDPPSAVMQTAITTLANMTFYISNDNRWYRPLAYVRLHFAELNSTANLTSRQFHILAPDGTDNVMNILNDTDPPAPFIHTSWTFGKQNIETDSVFTMYPTTTSSWGPILNAMEYFSVTDPSKSKTIDQDVVAIDNIRVSMNGAEWAGDPCLPYPHPWVNCSSPELVAPHITAVNLSGYHLEGTISPSFAKLVGLTNLSLDHNILNGSLPDLSFLTNLEILELENNNLSGALPEWLTSLKHLRVLTVHNNNFSGPIPAALLSSNSLQFTYQPGNPLLTGSGQSNLASKSSSNIAAIVGASVGGGLGLLFILIIGICLYPLLKLKKGSIAKGSIELGNSHGAKAYTLAEVIAMTSNFKTQIGKGGFGPVYYGKLPGGQLVAVKVADGSSSQGKNEFFNEVDVLSRVRHKNLVALLGYCQGDKKQILIYEYMPNGSLHDYLFGNSNTASIHEWKMRLGIALDAAQGLEYLHTGCSPSFIHRDIKSSNILLSSKYNAKVADFGLTKLMGETEAMGVVTFVKGTIGYLDPEYCTYHYLSAKSDVYSFGVVLLELITGRPSIVQTNSSQNGVNIYDWVRVNLEEGNIDAILDPMVKASCPTPNQGAFWKVVDIALQCLEPKGIHRPTMTNVLQDLHLVVTMEESTLTPHSLEPYMYSDIFSEMAPLPK